MVSVSRIPRIAIIDNDITLLALVGEVFADEGWELLPYGDSSVFPSVVEQQPDVILLDVWLEEATSGWQVLQHLAMDTSTRSIPVIVWSGDTEQLRDKAGWLDEHAIGIVAKPFEIDEVCETIEAALMRQVKHLERHS